MTELCMYVMRNFIDICSKSTRALVHKLNRQKQEDVIKTLAGPQIVYDGVNRWWVRGANESIRSPPFR